MMAPCLSCNPHTPPSSPLPTPTPHAESPVSISPEEHHTPSVLIAITLAMTLPPRDLEIYLGSDSPGVGFSMKLLL